MPIMNIEIHLSGRWERCAELTLTSSDATSRHGGVTLRHDEEYAADHLYEVGVQATSQPWCVNFR